MRTRFLAGAIGLILWLVCSLALAQGEFPLKFKEARPGQDPLMSTARMGVTRSPLKSQGLKGMPRGLTGKLTYFIARKPGHQV